MRLSSGQAVGPDDRFHFEELGKDSFDHKSLEGETMKKKIFSVIASCCFLALGAAATTRAQMPGTALRAMVPFDFNVRGRTLPAGEYEIRRLTDGPDGLLISGVNNRDHEILETEPVEARRIPSRAEVIVHRYGDTYFLSEVFAGGEQMGRELPESQRERSLKREMAASNDKRNQPETVALVAY